jgi:hypothetical protein
MNVRAKKRNKKLHMKVIETSADEHMKTKEKQSVNI